MANSSETKVTRRDAILTTGKAAVAFGAAALLAGRLPRMQPPVKTHNEVDGMDLEIPTGGLATVAITYLGNDNDEVGFGEVEPVNDTSNLINLGLVPIQFVISEIDPATGGTPIIPTIGLSRNTVSVMTVGSQIGDKGRHFLVHVWTDQQGAQAILPASAGANIVVGQSVDVEALEDAVRGLPGVGSLTINQGPDGVFPAKTYLLLAWGSLSPNAP